MCGRETSPVMTAVTPAEQLKLQRWLAKLHSGAVLHVAAAWLPQAPIQEQAGSLGVPD